MFDECSDAIASRESFPQALLVNAALGENFPLDIFSRNFSNEPDLQISSNSS